MGFLIIHSLGEKIVEHCAGAGSSSFSDYIKGDCFWFIVALVAAVAVEAIGLDFLFMGSGASTVQSPKPAASSKPSLEDFIKSDQPEPATSLSEIWASESPGNVALQDVIE